MSEQKKDEHQEHISRFRCPLPESIDKNLIVFGSILHIMALFRQQEGN